MDHVNFAAARTRASNMGREKVFPMAREASALNSGPLRAGLVLALVLTGQLGHPLAHCYPYGPDVAQTITGDKGYKG